MTIHPINTEAGYQAALAEIEQLVLEYLPTFLFSPINSQMLLPDLTVQNARFR